MEPIEGSSGSAQQYNLKWTNHTNNILEMFSEQLLNGLLVDVTLFCEGQIIKAHKMVLSACSPYFQELFRVHTVDHPVIIMNGARFVAVKQMVDFMYQGEIKVSDADLDHLLTIAENLQIKGLCKIRRESNDADQTPADFPKQENYPEPPNTPSTMPKRRKRRKLSQSPGAAVDESQTNGDCSSNPSMETFNDEPNTPVMKVTRPKNAFMIFAGEWRRKLANEYQGESNKDISVRLGNMWKTLSVSEKDEYFLAAKKAGEDHRLKYPDYHLAKAAKAALRERRTSNVRTSNVRRVKRKKSVVSTKKTPHLQEEPAVVPKEDMNTDDIKEEDPDENNLVVAESQCSDSSGENSASCKN